MFFYSSEVGSDEDKYAHTYPKKSTHKKGKHQHKNCHSDIDMTTPEKLLKKAEKNATKYKQDKKVCMKQCIALINDLFPFLNFDLNSMFPFIIII